MDLSNNKIVVELIKQAPMNLLFKDLEGRYILASNVCSHFSNVDLIGKTDEDIQPDKELGKLFLQDDLRVMAEKKPYKYIQKMKFGDEIFHYEISRNPLFDDSGEVIGMVGSVTDVTELVKLRELYYEKSIIDDLTGINNRAYLQDKYLKNEQDNDHYGIIMCDCNNLKVINDQYGHYSGDKLLKLVANTLKNNVEAQGEVMRIGGDEFLMIVYQADNNTCEALIHNIRTELAKNKIEGIPATASFGYAIKDQKINSLEKAISKADKMMYIDKNNIKQANDNQ
ncbi:MAG: sensor domain-containing diguanylate cyclase [Peptostreptococcaceae bacterium]